MKFRIERTPRELIENDELDAPKLTVLMGEKEVPDYNFSLPAEELDEYDKYMYEVMEGIFGVHDGVTEDELRAFLLSKGYKEVEEV